MNSCILITSHLNKPNKVWAGITQLEFFKKQNGILPIIYVGNYPIPEAIQQYSIVKQCQYTSDNPLTLRNRIMKTPTKTVIDYGYAHLSQMLMGFHLCKQLNYDYVYHFNYDVILEEGEYEKLLDISKNQDFIYHPWGDNNMNSCLFAIQTQKFIDAIAPLAHYYYHENPPGITNGWFFETWLKWAFEYSGVYSNLDNFSDIKFKLLVNN